MKRVFVGGGEAIVSPARRRFVAAVCIRLCNKIVSARRGPPYLSRWTLIVRRYIMIQQSLFNSVSLLEGSTLTLFRINQTTPGITNNSTTTLPGGTLRNS